MLPSVKMNNCAIEPFKGPEDGLLINCCPFLCSDRKQYRVHGSLCSELSSAWREWPALDLPQRDTEELPLLHTCPFWGNEVSIEHRASHRHYNSVSLLVPYLMLEKIFTSFSMPGDFFFLKASIFL